MFLKLKILTSVDKLRINSCSCVPDFRFAFFNMNSIKIRILVVLKHFSNYFVPHNNKTELNPFNFITKIKFKSVKSSI